MRVCACVGAWDNAHHAHRSPLFRRSPVYDTLLDDYEKGMTAARLDEIFGQARAAHGLAWLLGAAPCRPCGPGV